MPDFFAILHDFSDNPILLGLALAVFTLILEDAATVAAAAFAAEEFITPWWSLTALYSGIMIGDAGLYLFGKFAAANRPAQNFLQKRGVLKVKNSLRIRLFSVVFMARFIPGMRLTIYSACGFFNLSFMRFIAATACASCLWTTALFFSAYLLGESMPGSWGPWRWVAIAILILGIIVLPHTILRKKISATVKESTEN